MADDASHQITQLLSAWHDGDEFALERMMPLVYDELRVMAKRYMSSQPSGHTLQTTALIHEAYLKLAQDKDKRWENRRHFFGVAAQAMRHILVDHARSKHSEKRGGREMLVSLEDAPVVSSARASEIIELDEALKQLEKLDPRKGRVVELRYFGGFSLEETADVLGVSVQTVARDWRFAKMWLLRELAAK